MNGVVGADTMTGGAGNDIFKFLAGFGQDTITNFRRRRGGQQGSSGHQQPGITAGTFVASVKIAAGAGGTTMVSFGGSANSIRLLNEAPTSINMTDFKLA